MTQSLSLSVCQRLCCSVSHHSSWPLAPAMRPDTSSARATLEAKRLSAQIHSLITTTTTTTTKQNKNLNRQVLGPWATPQKNGTPCSLYVGIPPIPSHKLCLLSAAPSACHPRRRQPKANCFLPAPRAKCKLLDPLEKNADSCLDRLRSTAHYALGHINQPSAPAVCGGEDYAFVQSMPPERVGAGEYIQ